MHDKKPVFECVPEDLDHPTPSIPHASAHANPPQSLKRRTKYPKPKIF